MTVRDLIDDGGKLAPMLALQAGTEDLSNLVRCQAPWAEFAASLEQFVNWKVAFAGNMCRRSLRRLIGIQACIKLTNAPTAHACPANGCNEDLPLPLFPLKIAARFV